MFLCKILGLEDSFFRSILYVFCLFVFYTVFGSIVYVTLVGLPLVATGFGKFSKNTSENHITE